MLTHLFMLVSPVPIRASRMLFISCFAIGGIDVAVKLLLLLVVVVIVVFVVVFVVLLHFVNVVKKMSVMMMMK
jgi:hypothetical protein